MHLILGIDEVGRGPWAGPLVIGAVILPREEPNGELPAWTADLTDSKKLSEKKRLALDALIREKALAFGLGWVPARELDSLGLSAALKLATRRAVEKVQEKKIPFREIVIDGTINFLTGTPLESYVTVLKKADFLVKEVSAASILAKVARDSYMKSLAEKYPGYGFEHHVGYGTAAHRTALASLGPCPEHRKSFKPVQKILNISSEPKNNKTTTKQLGDRAETIVADHLRTLGHKILDRNHKTKFYEIDIVSVKEDNIYFTEVKYRKSQTRGTSLEMIDKKKLAKMSFAAESYLKLHRELNNFSPVLAAASVSGPDFRLDSWFPLV